MDPFIIDGSWWRPTTPSRKVPGRLQFALDGATLNVYDALTRFKMPKTQVVVSAVPTDWEIEPIILGRGNDGREFTLFTCRGFNLKGPFHTVNETYHPELILEGHHTNADSFSQLACSFDGLDLWGNARPLTNLGAAGGTMSVRIDSTVEATAQLADAVVELTVGVSGTSGDDRIDLTRWTSFRVTPAKPDTAKQLIHRFVRPLQDLMIFSLGRPVRLTSISLQPAKPAGVGTGLGPAYFEAVQPAAGEALKQADVYGGSAPTILTRRTSPLKFERLLPAWFQIRERHHEVVTLLLTPSYAPFMYSEHGFASIFQSAEALHNQLFDSQEVSKKQHKARVAAAVAAMKSAGLPPDTVSWAKGALAARNYKALGLRIGELVDATGAVRQAVLTADADFAVTCARARTGVSHGGAKKGLSAIQRYWYGDVLRWIVRTHLLTLLLSDDAKAQKIVIGRAAFARAIEGLK